MGSGSEAKAASAFPAKSIFKIKKKYGVNLLVICLTDF